MLEMVAGNGKAANAKGMGTPVLVVNTGVLTGFLGYFLKAHFLRGPVFVTAVIIAGVYGPLIFS